MPPADSVLTAVYDLQVCPCSYDFFQFLIGAELHRKRYSYHSINLVFLPGPKNGFREDQLRSNDQNDLFFKNVIIPGLSVLPSISSFHSYSSRKEFRFKSKPKLSSVYPRGYKVEKPIADYVFHGVVASQLREEEMVFFEAPDYCKKIAHEYLNKIAGNKKVVVLTTRELSREDSGSRSILKEVWKDFFAQLDPDFYQPLIIRDTSTAFSTDRLFNGVPELSAASIHLPLRLAIYQLSHLNFFKNNGPAVFGYYSKANAIIFNEFDSRHHALSEEYYKMHYGMKRGCQLPLTPQNSLILWGKENVAVLNQVLAVNWSEKSNQSNGYKDKENLILSMITGFNYLVENLKQGVLTEDAKTVLFAQKLIETHDFEWDIPQLIKDLEVKGWPKGTWAQIVKLQNTFK